MSIQHIMEKYGRLDKSGLQQEQNRLEQYLRNDKNRENKEEYKRVEEEYGKIRVFNQSLNTKNLEGALAAMGFLKDYRAGLN